MASTNKKLLIPLKCSLNKNLLFCCVKLIGYFASAVYAVSSNPCVGSSSKIRISLFLLSAYTDELISAPKIMTFLPILPSGNENSERESSPMP